MSAIRAARTLRAWHLDGLAAALLEPGGPLAFFGAQALYFAAPLLDGLGQRPLASDLAAVLDDPALTRAFAAQLSAPATRSAAVYPPPTPADPATARAMNDRAAARSAGTPPKDDTP